MGTQKYIRANDGTGVGIPIEEPSAMYFETDLSKRQFPGIAKAALEMSYCNGGINRDRRERDVLKILDAMLADGADLALDLPAIDAWLSALSDDDLQTVVDGEETEMLALLKSAPTGTGAFLTAIFERAA
jgi:hypothetical protein